MRLFVRKSISPTTEKYTIIFTESKTMILLKGKKICEFTKEAGVTLPYEVLDYLNGR